MSTSPADPTRRAFLRQACCAAVGSAGILSTLAQLRVLGAVTGPATAAATPSDYKALVCIFLSGGNDGANALIPFDNASYADYAKARVEVAVAQSRLLPLTPRTYTDGRRYALHPNLSEFQTLFGQGKLAVLGNVGTLLQPTSLAQYQAGTALPLQLFSHIDQSVQWQSSISDRPFETGWGGRLADLVNAFNTNNKISMSISLAGTNYFQVGARVTQYAVTTNGAITFTGSTARAGTNDSTRYLAQNSAYPTRYPIPAL